MALISTKTILTSLSLFHITLAFFFFTNPGSIAGQALVYVLGEAMGMPRTNTFNAPSPPLSFLSTALLVLGLSDILTLSMPEEIWLVHYWGSQAPLRMTMFTVITLYAWFTTPSTRRSGGGRLTHPIAPSGMANGGGWDGLRNRVFFAFAFIEMLSWFWVWVTLREESRAFTAKKRRRSSTSGGSMVR